MVGLKEDSSRCLSEIPFRHIQQRQKKNRKILSKDIGGTQEDSNTEPPEYKSEAFPQYQIPLQHQTNIKEQEQ
jgi:hypothetical protein